MKKLLVVLVILMNCLLSGCENQLGIEFSVTRKIEIDNKSEQEIVKEVSLLHCYNDEGSINWLEKSTDLYTQKNANIEFDIYTINPEEYDLILGQYFASGKMPDIYFSKNLFDDAEYIDKGFAMNLTNEKFMYDNFMYGTLRGVRYKDNLWAVPIDLNGYGVIYNKEVFEEVGIDGVPDTYTEFMQMCETFIKAGVLPIAAGYQDSWAMLEDLNADLMQSSYLNNTDWRISIEKNLYFWEDNFFQLNDALQRLSERQKYYRDDAFNTSWYEATKMVAKGEAAMIFSDFKAIDAIRKHNKDARIGLFSFPWSEDSGKNKFPIRTTGGVIANAKSANKDKLIDILEHFSTPEVGRYTHIYKKTPCVIKDVEENYDQAYIELMDYQDNGKTVDYSQYKSKFDNISLNRVFNEMLIRFLNDNNGDVNKYINQLDIETQHIINK